MCLWSGKDDKNVVFQLGTVGELSSKSEQTFESVRKVMANVDSAKP